MGPGYYGWGGMWGFPWMMVLFVIIVIFCLFFLLRGRRPWGCGSERDDRPRETPLEILKRRYAAGEISQEEFLRMKKEIE